MYRGYSSLHQFLRKSATEIKTMDSTYLLANNGSGYQPITYREAFEQLNAVSAYLVNLGFRKGQRAGLIVENCPQYYYFDQGIQQIGAINVSIYPTLSEKEIEYIINDSGLRVLLVGTHFLLKKIVKIEANCPTLEKIIPLFDDYSNISTSPKIISYTKMIEEGKVMYPQLKGKIEELYTAIETSDLAAFIYTSGTTGIPKGVMLTHENFMSNAITAKMLVPAVDETDRFLSFLPLSHVYERLATYYLSSYIGAEVAFAQNLESIVRNVGEVHPTLMACVPRLLERIEERVKKNATAQGGIKAKIFWWALGVGEEYRKVAESGGKAGLVLSAQHALAEKLVFSKIKERLGGKLKLFVSGGGPLPQHVGEFFGNIGIRIQEGYGLTETSPFVTVNEFHRQVYGTTGRVAVEQQVAIQDLESGKIITVQTFDNFHPEFESAEGEILIKGPNVMKGYWNKPEDTAAVFDADGWFHTGDVGKFHKGYLKITDRIKNMIVNSFGKNVYPTPIENTLLLSPKIEQILIIGDRREYLTAIIVPNMEELKEHFKLNEEFFQNADPFIREEEIIKWIGEDIKKLSVRLSKFERLRDFLIKRTAFSIEAGEMTPKLSIKRKVVEEMYAKDVEQMYAVSLCPLD
jgi:long-chain acyl-CoA synthetase